MSESSPIILGESDKDTFLDIVELRLLVTGTDAAPEDNTRMRTLTTRAFNTMAKILDNDIRWSHETGRAATRVVSKPDLSGIPHPVTEINLDKIVEDYSRSLKSKRILAPSAVRIWDTAIRTLEALQPFNEDVNEAERTTGEI